MTPRTSILPLSRNTKPKASLSILQWPLSRHKIWIISHNILLSPCQRSAICSNQLRSHFQIGVLRSEIFINDADLFIFYRTQSPGYYSSVGINHAHETLRKNGPCSQEGGYCPSELDKSSSHVELIDSHSCTITSANFDHRLQIAPQCDRLRLVKFSLPFEEDDFSIGGFLPTRSNFLRLNWPWIFVRCGVIACHPHNKCYCIFVLKDDSGFFFIIPFWGMFTCRYKYVSVLLLCVFAANYRKQTNK